MNFYGFTREQWEKAKQQATHILVEKAKAGAMIPYSELVTSIKSIELEPHDQRLFALLGEISTAEDAEGRGMLSAIVVHKNGDMQPGPGFFELAKKLGKDASDIDKCWIAEIRKVFACWTKKQN